MSDKKEHSRRCNTLTAALVPAAPLPPVVPVPPGPMLTPDEEAWFTAMYGELRRIAESTLASIGVREWERDELAGDALVRVAKNLARLTGPNHARNYARRAALCEWIDRRRCPYPRRTVRIAADADGADADVRDDAVGPAEEVALREAADSVLAALPPMDAAIVRRFTTAPNERDHIARELRLHYSRVARAIRNAEAAVAAALGR